MDTKSLIDILRLNSEMVAAVSKIMRNQRFNFSGEEVPSYLQSLKQQLAFQIGFLFVCNQFTC